MGFLKKASSVGVSLCLLASAPSYADDFKRSDVYQAFYAYIVNGTPIDQRYLTDVQALSDLIVASQQVNAPTVQNTTARLKQQFRWWLERRGDDFLDDDDDGPDDGCSGGGAGSRDDDDDDDCGGSDN